MPPFKKCPKQGCEGNLRFKRNSVLMYCPKCKYEHGSEEQIRLAAAMALKQLKDINETK